MSFLRHLAVVAALAAPQYVPPVDAPIVDAFRPPSTPYGAGNRGVDYDTAPGEAVRAAAPGRVVFAGRVGRDHHVVLLHDDGVRTTYGFLAAVSVRRGQRLRAGDAVGLATEQLHFGARVGDAYVDPQALFGGGGAPARLVDDGADAPASGSERRAFVELLRSAGVRRLSPARMRVRWALGRRLHDQGDEQLRAGRGEVMRR